MENKQIKIKESSIPFNSVVANEYEESSTDDDKLLVTPQWIINSLPRYTIRSGVYTPADNFCGICYRKYNVGDSAICLPCHHNFHYYCIENWLKCVKSTCPIDKKSVIRKQYWKDMINKRRNHLSEACSLNETTDVFLQINNNNEEDKQSSNSSSEESIILDDNIPCTTLKKKRKRKEILAQKPGSQESKSEVLEAQDPGVPDIQEPLAEIRSRMLSSLKLQLAKRPDTLCYTDSGDDPENTAVKNNYKDLKILFPDTKQLRDSVKTIRCSLKQNTCSRTKLKKPEGYQEVLDELVSKLSKIKIKTHPASTKTNNENCNWKMSLQNMSPAKSEPVTEYLSQQATARKRNLTFGELVNLGKENNSNKKSSNLTNDIPVKYQHLLRKKL